MFNADWKTGVAAAGMLLLAAGCNGAQRDSALRVVRSMQQSGTAEAAVLPDSLMQEKSPPAAPPSAPPPAAGADKGDDKGDKGATDKAASGKGAADKADKKDGAAPGAPAADKPKTSEDIIKDFMGSDPRNILEEKKNRLKEKETKPWDENNPDTFVPETGRKDPLTPVRKSMPKELLPPRTGDEDSDILTYQLTTEATKVLNGITQNLQCYSVIQIGLTKYARVSFDGGETIRTINQNTSFQQPIRTRQGTVVLTFAVVSIATDEVVMDVVVAGQDTKVSVQKEMVFIPRNYQ